jgi:hypothetical protein
MYPIHDPQRTYPLLPVPISADHCEEPTSPVAEGRMMTMRQIDSEFGQKFRADDPDFPKAPPGLEALGLGELYARYLVLTARLAISEEQFAKEKQASERGEPMHDAGRCNCPDEDERFHVKNAIASRVPRSLADLKIKAMVALHHFRREYGDESMIRQLCEDIVEMRDGEGRA